MHGGGRGHMLHGGNRGARRRDLRRDPDTARLRNENADHGHADSDEDCNRRVYGRGYAWANRDGGNGTNGYGYEHEVVRLLLPLLPFLPFLLTGRL